MGGKHHARPNRFSTRQAEIARNASAKLAAKQATGTTKTVPVQPPAPATATTAKPNPYQRLLTKIDNDNRRTESPGGR